MAKKLETYFDSHAEDYAEQITATQPQFYRNAGAILNSHLREGDAVLDIGNGGVINYDYERLARLDCADIVLSRSAMEKYKDCGNIRFFQADVTDMSETPSGSYDVVIMQAIIHHLAGKTYAETYARVSAAIRECGRVLKPGGKLLIVESTVTGWFCSLERLLYPAMQLFFRICKFGCVFQFSPRSLRALLDGVSGVEVLSEENVPIGPHIWIMGKKVPTIVTPCGATFYLLQKGNAP